MLIRSAGPGDYEAYCALAFEADALHTEQAPRYFRQGDGPSRPRKYFDSILDEDAKMSFVAEIDGEVVGHVHLEERAEPDFPVLVPMKWIHVSEIVVGKDFQRRGVGRALMQRTKEWALERGCRDLRLTVVDFNEEAKAFYRREGFSVKSVGLVLPLD